PHARPPSRRLVAQPVPRVGGVAELVLASGLAQQAALADVAAGVFGFGGVEVKLVILLGGPAYYVKHGGSALVLRRVGRFFQHDSGAASEKFQRFDKTDVFVPLDKADDIARLATGPTAVALAERVNVEAGSVVVGERAEALEGAAGGSQRNIGADNLDDVVGLFDLFDPVVRQGPPGEEKQRLYIISHWQDRAINGRTWPREVRG